VDAGYSLDSTFVHNRGHVGSEGKHCTHLLFEVSSSGVVSSLWRKRFVIQVSFHDAFDEEGDNE